MTGLASVPHRHTYCVILWAFSGVGKHVIDCQEYDILPHSIFFIAPHQVHCMEANPEGLLILFEPEFAAGSSRAALLDPLFDPAGGRPPLMLAPSSIKPLMASANGMMDAFRSADPFRLETIAAYLRLFLIECNRQSASTSVAAVPGGRLVREFKRLVEERFRRAHHVGDYARALGISANHLSEVMHRGLNQAPKEYIQDRLLMEAKRQLLFTDRSVKEIGFDLGFAEPSLFSRFFKTASGLSVREFRGKAP